MALIQRRDDTVTQLQKKISTDIESRLKTRPSGNDGTTADDDMYKKSQSRFNARTIFLAGMAVAVVACFVILATS